MDVFNEYVLPPTSEHLELLRYLLMLVSLIHFPFVGIVIGSSLLSLTFNLWDKDEPNSVYARMTRDLMDMAIPGREALVVFGILPLPAIWVIYGQWLTQSTVNTMHLLPVGSAMVAIGLLTLAVYRSGIHPMGQNSVFNIGIGGLGLATLLLGTYVLLGSVTRFFDPERWFLSHHAMRTLTSWNLIWRYLVFLAAGLAITGGAILFFFFTWPGRVRMSAEDDTRLAKNLGAGVSIIGMFLFPVFGFFYLFTLPVIALSGAIYVVGAAAVFTLFIIFVVVFRTFFSQVPRFGAPAFVLFIVVFGLLIVGDQIALVNATREHVAALITQAEEREAEITFQREVERAAAIVADPVKGQEVFENVCLTCHRWDERLVGPPFDEVLPKYEGKTGELEAFIQKPQKVNPDYPPMPAPGLSLTEIKSVAAYLMGQIESRTSSEHGESKTRESRQVESEQIESSGSDEG